MIVSIETELKLNFKASGNEEIYQNLSILFSTPVGTIPFNRDFGIDWSILDKPLPAVKALLTAEYTKKVRMFEPRAKIKEVFYDYDSDHDVLRPKVVVDIVS